MRTTRQTRSNNTVKDTFYWPDMTVSNAPLILTLALVQQCYASGGQSIAAGLCLISALCRSRPPQRKDVIRNTDAQGLPSANQLYVIPEAFKANPNNFHNRGLYSMWAHFVEFCVHNSVFFTKKYRDLTTEPFFQTSAYRENPHVPGAKRLDTFVQLSLGVSMSWKAQIAPSSVPLIEELHVPREVEEHVEPAAPNGARRFWNEGAAASYYHVPPSVSFEPAWNAPAVRVGDANDWGSSTLDIWDGTASESFDSWEHANVCSVSGHHDRAYSPDSVILSANRSVEGLGVDRPLCIDTNSMWDASCESGAPTDSTQIHAWRDGPGTMGFASRPSSFYFPPSEIDPSLSSLQLHTPMQHQQQQQQLQPQQLPPQLPYQLQHTSSISEFYPKSNRVSSNNNSLSMLDLDLR